MTAWVGNQVWVEPDGRSYIPTAAPALALSRLGQHKKAQPTFWPRIAHFITFVETLSSYYCFNTGSFQQLIKISINWSFSKHGFHQKSGRSSVRRGVFGWFLKCQRAAWWGGAGAAIRCLLLLADHQQFIVWTFCYIIIWQFSGLCIYFEACVL